MKNLTNKKNLLYSVITSVKKLNILFKNYTLIGGKNG